MRLIRSSLHAMCDQSREAISRRLDGELSELDEARLELHLRDCTECRAFDTDARRTTAMLRAAALAEPAFEIRLPRRRHVPVRMLQAGAAAVAVAAVAGLSTVHGLGQRESAAPSALAANFALGHDDELAPDRHPVPRLQFRTAL